MPMGTVERGITLEFQNKNEILLIKVITGRGGYFVIPNIPVNTYFLSRVIFLLAISDTAQVTTKYRSPNPEAAKAYLARRHGDTVVKTEI